MGYKKITLILWLGILFSAERSANAQSITFNYTGAQQTWTVPTCVSQITLTMQGGAGGNANYCIGNGYYNGEGEGGTVVGTLTVTPGELLYVYVGGRGADGITNSPGAAGGWNGGGNGAYYSGAYGGGGGGGESDVRIGGNAYANVIAVAGGGGGEAFNYGCGTEMGGSGGTSTGQCGFEDYTSYCGSPNPPGGGGSQVAGGAGGYLGGYCTASNGSQGQGGAGGSCNNDGGGGGGGYYGGGGGVWGGGGGGSSYTGGLTTVISNTLGGNTSNGVITIQYGAVSLTPVVMTNVRCHGGNTGSARFTVVGGNTPYTYLWAPSGGSKDTATGLTAGIYTITVSIPCGGSSTATVTITQPAAVGVTTTVNANVLCNGGNNGKITANPSNGTSPYTYLWAPTGQTTVSATGLTAGTYTVTLTDNCGATVTASNTITQPGVLKDSAYNLTNVLCNGGANGSVGSLTTGGTTPYTYLWTPTGRTTDTIRNLSAGSYTVSVTDSHGCSTTSSAIVTQPTVLQDSVFVTANVLCNGQSNGSASSITMGGVMPYTYLWNPTGQTTASASALTAGTYTLSVHDSNGCTASGSVTITQPNVLTAVATAYSNVVCNGGSSGDASVMPMGGTMPYTYSWTPGGSTSDSATGLSAGTYTVNVWDSNDCNTSTTVTVTQPIALIVGAGTVINNLCNGDNIGMAVAYVSGGPAPYTYSWSPIGGNGDTASGLSIGTYVVNVTDINGCTGSASTTVTQPSALSIVLNSVPDDGSCSGSAWLQVTGGVAPYTYLWVSGGATSYIISNQCAGNYCCRVTDANGCYDNVCVDIASYLGVNSVNANSGGVKIYPNPTNGQFTIENVSVSESSVIEIYNVLGEEVTSAVLDVKQGGTTTVNIGNEPNGVYLYRVKSLSNGSLLGEGKIALEK